MSRIPLCSAAKAEGRESGVGPVSVLSPVVGTSLLPTVLQVQLEKQISETVQLCKQSLFIFDEAEKLHFGLLEVIKPFMARSDKGQQDNRRSIFLFLR